MLGTMPSKRPAPKARQVWRRNRDGVSVEILDVLPEARMVKVQAAGEGHYLVATIWLGTRYSFLHSHD